MKISDVDGIKGPEKPKKTKKTGDKGAFDAALSEAEGVEETSATRAPSSVDAVEAPSALLSLQEVAEGSGLRQQTMKQGKQSLAVLEDLRRDMLLGDDNPHLLQRLREQQTRMKQQVFDPSLKEVMDDIDLRLAVEIAKREDVTA